MDGGLQELDYGTPDDPRRVARCNLVVPLEAQEYAIYK